jgi:hypothetical protein
MGELSRKAILLKASGIICRVITFFNTAGCILPFTIHNSRRAFERQSGQPIDSVKSGIGAKHKKDIG